jgi:hypothetical protein
MNIINIVAYCVMNNTAQQQQNFLGVLVFRPVPGVIWAADSENYIG